MEATAEQAIRTKWGGALKAARRKAGMTQMQFAVHIGWDLQRVSRMERGYGSIETFATAAADLGVELVVSEGS